MIKWGHMNVLKTQSIKCFFFSFWTLFFYFYFYFFFLFFLLFFPLIPFNLFSHSFPLLLLFLLHSSWFESWWHSHHLSFLGTTLTPNLNLHHTLFFHNARCLLIGNIHDCKHNCCIGATNHRDRVIDIVTRSHHDGITCVKGWATLPLLCAMLACCVQRWVMDLWMKTTNGDLFKTFNFDLIDVDLKFI